MPLQPVHPRACGEHHGGEACNASGSGSSPRMRGTRAPAGVAGVPGRFIPAHAGNTPPGMQIRPPLAVHPRACGEHAVSCSPNFSTSGSSPRMRGTPVIIPVQHPSIRFIPAHAGNTPGKSPGRRPTAVHPRACGEHDLPNSFMAIADGSSPRMRGTRQSPKTPRHGLRFIPAHAGNTHAGLSKGSFPAVHPRACGEHNLLFAKNHVETGSSPRMRGTRVANPFRIFLHRFIPAHAGNT